MNLRGPAPEVMIRRCVDPPRLGPRITKGGVEMRMTEHTAEFLAQYRKEYGPGYRPVAPDHNFCAYSVYGTGRGASSYQCTRKNGSGPHGAWCKQHDPDARKAKSDARAEKWREEYDAKDRLRKATEALQIALATIANGCNDPQGLAADVMAELNASREAVK